ncbi:kinase-like protein [Gigaspora margarita]|uniref:Kinase-like protein n=1 Tax=Gigaspora margarita TaxID=4874 RepID=A0A8H3XFF4_GIGMA|nr:kinase-like protein [Gigaspora margarita]
MEGVNRSDAYEPTKYEGNRFVLNQLEITVRALTSAVEASASYVPFAPLIEKFVKLGEDIVMLYKKAEHNKRLCNYLTKRVNSAVALMNDLEIRKQDNQKFFMESTNLQLIKDFVKCMLDIRRFVADVSQLGIIGISHNSANIVQKYKDLSNRFDGYLTSLNVAINKEAISRNESQPFINDNKDDNISETINSLNEVTLSSEDLELQYEIEVIKEDLLEMKKFMNDMSNSKPGSEDNIFTNIKRIRDLNVNYQRNLRKGTEISIVSQYILKLDDYEPKSDYPRRGELIHCRWSRASLSNYAFKEIYLLTDDQIKDFSQQIAILKELENSEYIVRFYGIALSSDKTNGYLVTEWMEKGNLREYYKNHKLDWNKKFEFAIDICQGIAFLNAVEILHHDIRGANILISHNHRAKIANFSLSRIVNKGNGIDIRFLENLRYMAPEKLEYRDKKRYNVKCEIYSLGALLWEIAEEEIPYTRLGIDFPTIRERIVKEKYREPFSSDVPKVWQVTAYAAMNHDPDFRPTIAKIFSALYDYHHKDEKKEILPVRDDDFMLFDEMMSVDQAIEEHQKPDGNKQKAWESFKYHAELGDIIAKYWVGYYLYHSILPEHKENRQENLQHAAILFKEAADHGKVEAQLRYGFCLWQGDGVPVNWDEAMRYLKLAADNGNPTAMYNVGSAYWIGKGVIKDQEIGSKYLKMAAKKDQHNAIAMCKKLGIPY